MKVPISLARAVSRNVKTARIQAGLNPKELAERSGLSTAYISRMERNPQNMIIGTLGILAHVLGASPISLMRLTDAEKLSAKFARPHLKEYWKLKWPLSVEDHEWFRRSCLHPKSLWFDKAMALELGSTNISDRFPTRVTNAEPCAGSSRH